MACSGLLMLSGTPGSYKDEHYARYSGQFFCDGMPQIRGCNPVLICVYAFLLFFKSPQLAQVS
jgi:hypothetical protein